MTRKLSPRKAEKTIQWLIDQVFAIQIKGNEVWIWDKGWQERIVLPKSIFEAMWRWYNEEQEINE